MKYAQIVPFEVCNGEGIGISLFVQGCHFHCNGCFNEKLWDFNGGKEWNNDIEKQFIELAGKPYIKRITILGGEPLAKENYLNVRHLLQKLNEKYPNKKLWLYTGYTLDEIKETRELLRTIIYCDVLIDGRFQIDKKDVTLCFKGSSNQNIWKKENEEWIKEGN